MGSGRAYRDRMDPMIPAEHRTERLILGRPVEDDVDALQPLFDAEVVRYLDGVVPSREDMWRGLCSWLGHWELRGYGMWTWVEKDSGTVVGRGGLWYPLGWPQLEVGWMLGRAYWGHGYATEVGRAALASPGPARPRLGVQRDPPRQPGLAGRGPPPRGPGGRVHHGAGLPGRDLALDRPPQGPHRAR